MSGKKKLVKTSTLFSAALVLILSLLIWPIQRVSADDLLNRSISVSSSFTSEIVTHSYQFTTQTPSNIGSIQFQYCFNSPLFDQPCITPTGIDVSGAGILSESGLTGFSISPATTNGNLIISRAPAAEVATTASYIFDNVLNPSVAYNSIFVRITVFDDVDGGGAIVDRGAVVFVLEDRFDVELYVPPYLTFCVGVTVAIDCTSASGFLADFGEFSEFVPTTATTQFAAATNDPTGYNVFVNGQTLTSGANIIPNLTVQTPSIPGTSQYGINLRANSSPSVGSNVEAGPLAVGSVAANYNNPNSFRYVSGERLAGASSSTGYNRYTVSYIVNISEDQNPGVYASTLTYTAIASF